MAEKTFAERWAERHDIAKWLRYWANRNDTRLEARKTCLQAALLIEAADKVFGDNAPNQSISAR